MAVDDDYSDKGFVEWIPGYTGVDTIVVINHGDVYIAYYFEAS